MMLPPSVAGAAMLALLPLSLPLSAASAPAPASAAHAPANAVPAPANTAPAPANAVPAPATHAPTVHAPATVTHASAPAADTLTFVVAEEGNQARYRVREQLASLDFPNDAVGATNGIQGRITVTPEGEVVREASRFVIDLAALESDRGRRDNFLRRNTLRTEEYPQAVFVPTEIRGLPNAVPSSGEASVVLVGELTIRGVTRPVEWQTEVEFWEGALIGQARTQFTFGDFELEVPSVGSVLSIRDDIRLEYDFRLVPDG